jgi:hypothetical protein
VRFGRPLALVLVLVLFGVPIWSARTGVRLEPPVHWQRGSDAVQAADAAISLARPDQLILAPDELSITIDVMTTRVKTVAPRDYFMDYLRDNPTFDYADRLTLVHFANGQLRDRWEVKVADALRRVAVDMVCLPVASQTEDIPTADTRWRPRFLRSQGFRTVSTPSTHYTVFVR